MHISLMLNAIPLLQHNRPRLYIYSELVFQALCALPVGTEHSDNTRVQTADLYTTGKHVHPINIQSVTGTDLHITDAPTNNQTREILVHDRAIVSGVSTKTKTHPEGKRQSDYRPCADTGDSSWGRSDITDEFRSGDGHRGEHSISMYTADLSTLLLQCGDIEPNPGPTDEDVKPPHLNHKSSEVSRDMHVL